MLKWLLYRWFNFSIRRKRIDAEYFASKLFDFVKSRGKWRKKYAYLKFVYCSDKYMEIYGSKEYSELADKLFQMIGSEEEKSRAKISDQLKIFFKDK